MDHRDQEHFESLKASRMERKRLSTKDRSKFKKTDREKFRKDFKEQIKSRSQDRDLLRGRVLSITSQGYMVDHEGTTFTCFLRGLLKREKTKKKNIVTVGDFVLFEEMPDQEGFILDVEPRKSVLSRADNLSRLKEQLIAANIDQVLITVSVVSPSLKPALIDRYIIAAKKGNMDPVILINKIDLLEGDQYDPSLIKEQKETLKACQEAYEAADIPIILMSAKEGVALDQLKEIMKDKASVFSGQSGTGKSSLINAVTGLDLPVGETVKKTRKGAHTTTIAHLVPLTCGGWCIDTPGIKSFGVWDLKPEELQFYFSEIQEKSSGCKFPNCIHLHESQCAVKEALEKGMIAPIRYASYSSLMETIQEEHKKR